MQIEIGIAYAQSRNGDILVLPGEDLHHGYLGIYRNGLELPGHRKGESVPLEPDIRQCGIRPVGKDKLRLFSGTDDSRTPYIQKTASAPVRDFYRTWDRRCVRTLLCNPD